MYIWPKLFAKAVFASCAAANSIAIWAASVLAIAKSDWRLANSVAWSELRFVMSDSKLTIVVKAISRDAYQDTKYLFYYHTHP